MYSSNLGQGVPAGQRFAFKPPQASNPRLLPALLKTQFISHIHAFPSIMPAAVAFPVTIPGPSQAMRPGGRSPNRRRPAAPPTSTPAMPTAIPSALPASAANAAAAAGGGMKGFGASGLGAGPYNLMRTGAWSPYSQSLAHIRSGVAKAPQMIRRATSPYTASNTPAGGYRARGAY